MKTSVDWATANHRYLTARLEVLRHRIEDPDESVSEATEELAAAAAALPRPAAIDRVAEVFRLTPFEVDLLLLVAGQELDSDFAEACRETEGRGGSGVTFTFALSHLPDAHWSAVTPAGPLRRWRLLDFADGDSPSRAVLRVDERVLHYLVGVSYLDPRLEGSVRPVPIPTSLPASHRTVAQRISEFLAAPSSSARSTIIHTIGGEDGISRRIAAMACGNLGLRLHSLRAADLPVQPTERQAFMRLWEREAALEGSALLLEISENDSESAVDSFVDAAHGILLISGTRSPRTDRQVLRFDCGSTTFQERASAWGEALGPASTAFNGTVDRLAAQFRLGYGDLLDIAGESVRLAPSAEPAALEQQIWDRCRMRSRRGLDRLAQRIETRAGWDHIVLPPEQIQALKGIVAQVRQQARVLETWGFAQQTSRGLGVSALFAGASGTGKTLAAEVVAHELSLDLYRIDLSQVISKYIGETEKNLRNVFDAAEGGGAVLLFDEADALFGKRSEVKDSHDRYANIEVSYLLQRMEEYRGLAILTTNQKDALDKAFLRRIRFVITFPFPDVEQRMEIWRKVFPPQTPTQKLDVRQLARLSVTGGHIRNIAIGAAFLAAEDNLPVRMSHVMQAARAEYTKLDRPLTHAEIGGWA